MNLKTRIDWLSDGWKRAKNHCRVTVNKEFSDNEPTAKFKKKLLISEHSPIRDLVVNWSWLKIYSWVATEWSRHKFEKYISTQRDDRCENQTPRGKKPQDAAVDFSGVANSQNTIDAWRKRLCYQTTDEARELGESFKAELHKYEPEWSDVLVPNCIYRCGCPEFEMCEQKFFAHFIAQCKEDKVNIYNIQERYDEYNKLFYENRKESFEQNESDSFEQLTLNSLMDSGERNVNE